MLKKIILILVFGLLLSVSAIAADEQSASQPDKKSVKGWFVSADENSVVIVDDNNANATFKVDKATKFIDAPNNNAIVAATALAADDRVRVDLNGEVAVKVVKLITDMKKAGAAEKKAEASAAKAGEEEKANNTAKPSEKKSEAK